MPYILERILEELDFFHNFDLQTSHQSAKHELYYCR